MTGARKAQFAAGAVGSGLAAFVLGLVGSELRSNSSVALRLLAMVALAVWPLFLRGAPWGARGALTAVVVAALFAGFHYSDCGRDGQGSGSEICLGQCAESVRRLRDYQRDCWTLESGRLGRWAIAMTCGTADPLRDWRGARCASSDFSR